MKRKKTIVYKTDSATKEKKLAAILEFDENGNRTLEQYYMFDGETINEETKFVYDDNGNLTQKTIKNNEQESQRLERSYDDNGHLIEEKVFISGDKLEQHRIVKWAEDHLSSNTEYRNVQGEIVNTVETILAEKGVLQREVIYDERQRVVEAYDYEYENGNLVRKTVDFGGFSTIDSFKYTFDENGNITSKQKIDDEGDTETHEIEYHANNKKARQEVTLVSGIKEIVEYDEEEREVKIQRIDVTGYNSFESHTRYSDDHQLMTEKVVRNDETVTQFTYDYEFFEEPENA